MTAVGIEPATFRFIAQHQKEQRPLLTKSGDNGRCRRPKHVATLNKGPIYWICMVVFVTQ